MNHKKKRGEYEVFKCVDWVEEKAKLDQEKEKICKVRLRMKE